MNNNYIYLIISSIALMFFTLTGKIVWDFLKRGKEYPSIKIEDALKDIQLNIKEIFNVISDIKDNYVKKDEFIKKMDDLKKVEMNTIGLEKDIETLKNDFDSLFISVREWKNNENINTRK